MSKILLVEDNPDAVKRIIRYINKIFAELDVVSFPEAGDALQYAKANDISLFIVEYVTQDIAYIEAFGKKLVIHTISRLSGIKEDTISGYTLSGLLALLDDPAFVQCHKSYVVNKSHIEKIDKSERKIFLKGFTDTIPIGNKYQAELWG